jgi:hypothetical protein
LLGAIFFRLSNGIQEDLVNFLIPKELHGSKFLWGAHHPHCERHSHHLIWVKGHPLCLGCTSLFAGILVGVPISWAATPLGMSLFLWITLHFVFLIPTVIQPFIQIKSFKIFSRFLLGMAVSSYFVTGFYLQLPINLGAFFLLRIVAFVTVYFLLSRWRAKKIDNPCLNCPLGHYPICEWNLPRLLADPQQEIIFKEFSEKNSPN